MTIEREGENAHWFTAIYCATHFSIWCASGCGRRWSLANNETYCSIGNALSFVFLLAENKT